MEYRVQQSGIYAKEALKYKQIYMDRLMMSEYEDLSEEIEKTIQSSLYMFRRAKGSFDGPLQDVVDSMSKCIDYNRCPPHVRIHGVDIRTKIASEMEHMMVTVLKSYIKAHKILLDAQSESDAPVHIDRYINRSKSLLEKMLDDYHEISITKFLKNIDRTYEMGTITDLSDNNIVDTLYKNIKREPLIRKTLAASIYTDIDTKMREIFGEWCEDDSENDSIIDNYKKIRRYIRDPNRVKGLIKEFLADGNRYRSMSSMFRKIEEFFSDINATIVDIYAIALMFVRHNDGSSPEYLMGYLGDYHVKHYIDFFKSFPDYRHEEWKKGDNSRTRRIHRIRDSKITKDQLLDFNTTHMFP